MPAISYPNRIQAVKAVIYGPRDVGRACAR
jgi:hypothetical protein